MPVDFETKIRQNLDALRSSQRYRELTLGDNISFIHNDYLDLSRHPEILAAGENALKRLGAGSKGSRLLGGHSQIFERVEQRIADFFQAPASLFFSTGFLANQAAVQVLGDQVDLIVSDEKNHASLIDGVRLCGKPKQILPHLRWDTLDSSVGPLLAITETIFSMDGDGVNEADISALLENENVFLLLDEAHAAGVFGERGRGWIEKSTLPWEKTAVTVTFGKAFGVGGAALLCSRAVKELMVNYGRAFIYTTAPSPVVPAMVEAALDVVDREGWRRELLWERGRKIREILEKANDIQKRFSPFVVPQSAREWQCPIVPFLIPGEENVLRFCQNMRESGFGVKAIRYPTVPRGSERVRISLSLAISEENTEAMAYRMVELWKGFSLQEPIPR